MLSKMPRVILSAAKEPALGLSMRLCEILRVAQDDTIADYCIIGLHLYDL